MNYLCIHQVGKEKSKFYCGFMGMTFIVWQVDMNVLEEPFTTIYHEDHDSEFIQNLVTTDHAIGCHTSQDHNMKTTSLT
jgi:hypothetical protein